MKNDFIDPKIMHGHLVFCQAYDGPKNCNGNLHKTSFHLYDENGNELTDENRYASKIHFKCKCDKCGHEAFLTYNPDASCVLY